MAGAGARRNDAYDAEKICATSTVARRASPGRYRL
jgi:hypothetical protein